MFWRAFWPGQQVFTHGMKHTLYWLWVIAASVTVSCVWARRWVRPPHVAAPGLQLPLRHAGMRTPDTCS